MSEVQWYIQVGDGKKAGPISFEKLQQLAQKGKFFPTTKLRSNEEGAVWVAANTVPGLFDAEPESQPLPSIFDAVPVSDDSVTTDSSDHSEEPVAETTAEAPTDEPVEQEPEQETEKPASVSGFSIKVGDRSSSAATVKVSPFAINPKGGTSKKGFVDPKAKKDSKQTVSEPAPKTEPAKTETTEKKSGGFFGFSSKKKDESSAAPVASKSAENEKGSTARKISIGGSSDGSTARKITIGAPADDKSKSTGFPKISIGGKDSKKESGVEPEASTAESDASAESTTEQGTEPVASFFGDAEPTSDEPTVANSDETATETLSGKKDELTAENVPVVVRGSAVPVWLLVVMILVLATALIVNGVLVYLAAAKIEKSLGGSGQPPSSTVEEKATAPKALKTEEPEE